MTQIELLSWAGAIVGSILIVGVPTAFIVLFIVSVIKGDKSKKGGTK